MTNRKKEARDGKLVLKGNLWLLTAALVGSGKGEACDVELVRDGKGIPYLPFTSLIGVLRHSICPKGHDEELRSFWGYSEGEAGKQSAVLGRDLKVCEGKAIVTLRDGIAIDPANGIVFDQEKYDYEVLEPGIAFDLFLEADYDEKTRVFCEKMLRTIRERLESGKIHVGAKTNNGLGRVQLKDAVLCRFDWTKKEDLRRWFGQDFSVPAESNQEPFAEEARELSVEVDLELLHSLIIRSYSDDPNAPDATHIRSNGKDILTGSGFKGALRGRAWRILKTLGKREEEAKEILHRLFGNVDDEARSSTALKGKLRVEEVELPHFVREVQNRIKIDRFTGGTIESALFDSMPLFREEKSKPIEGVRIVVKDYKGWDAGLVLLLLKDLWTGDLAVGGEKNVGRGVFQGQRATVGWKDPDGKTRQTVLSKNGSGLAIEPSSDRETLEKWVNELVEWKGKNHARD